MNQETKLADGNEKEERNIISKYKRKKLLLKLKNRTMYVECIS